MVLVASPSMRAEKGAHAGLDSKVRAPNRQETGLALPVYSVYDTLSRHSSSTAPMQSDFASSSYAQSPTPIPLPKDYKPPSDEPASERFCAPDADMALYSSDGVLFRVYSADIRTFSTGFPNPSLIQKSDSSFQLTEPESVLEVLLQFMRNQRPPDISVLPFRLLAEVADAIERYKVNQSARLFQLHMKQSIKDHPFDVLAYALRHSLTDMADEAAEQCLYGTLNLNQPPLRGKALLAFMLYREQFTSLLEFLSQPPTASKHSRSFTAHKPRDLHTQCYAPIIWSIQGDLGLVRAKLKEELDQKMDEGCSSLKCSTCKKDYVTWKTGLTERIDKVQPFREFLGKVECNTL